VGAYLPHLQPPPQQQQQQQQQPPRLPAPAARLNRACAAAAAPRSAISLTRLAARPHFPQFTRLNDMEAERRAQKNGGGGHH